MSDLDVGAASSTAVGGPGHEVCRLGMNLDESARALGVARNTMSRLIDEGRIRAVRVGRRVIVDVRSIHEFLSRGCDDA